MNAPATQNNSGMTMAPLVSGGGMMSTEVAKAIGEIQANIITAKTFPRDILQAREAIINECSNPGIAESALYSFKRGDTIVEGESIRMAEMMARNWQNIGFGVRELEQRNGESVMQAYAWDMQTNVKQERTFTVKHWRDTKQGGYALKESRDIMEIVGNHASRRLRECILALIPKDIRDAAVAQVVKTLSITDEPRDVRIDKMRAGFAAMDITSEMLEKSIGHSLDSITDHELIRLRGMYKALKDNIVDKSYYWPEVATQSTADNLTKTAAEKRSKREAAATVQQAERSEMEPESILDSDKVIHYMNIANNFDELDVAMDMANTLPEKDRAELNTIYLQRRKELQAKLKANK